MAHMETQIKLENVSSVQKKFIVTIPAGKVDQTIEKKFAEAQKTAKIKGFRPGKVPLNLVKQYYKDEVNQNALNALINETYFEALKKHELRIVGEPSFEGAKEKEHIHIAEGKELSYVATVEVVPEVDPKDYKGLSVEKIAPEVNADDIEKVKKNLLDRKAEISPASRAAKTGDFVDFKYDGKLKTDNGFESQANLSGERNAEIGSGQLLPEFEKNLIGLKAGDSKTFKMTYAKEFTDANLAGKEAEYTVDVREVKEKILPSFTDELVKEFGYENLSDFEVKSKEMLTKNKAEESENSLRNNMIEKLIEKNPIEVPQGLVYSQMRALADDYSNELKRYGFNDQMIQSAVVSQLQDFKKRAETQVRAGILLDAIAKKEKITAKDSDIESEMQKMASMYGVETKMLKDRFESSPRDKSNFEYRVREELTIKMILDSAKISVAKESKKK
jgi:trigger factor